MNAPSSALAFSRPLIRFLIVLNLLYAAGVVLMIIVSLVPGTILWIGAIAWAAIRDVKDMDLDLGYSLAPWLAILLLFVLARVFAEGTRMRTDLEGTV